VFIAQPAPPVRQLCDAAAAAAAAVDGLCVFLVVDFD
jgi:hypothetical protein